MHRSISRVKPTGIAHNDPKDASHRLLELQATELLIAFSQPVSSLHRINILSADYPLVELARARFFGLLAINDLWCF